MTDPTATRVAQAHALDFPNTTDAMILHVVPWDSPSALCRVPVAVLARADYEALVAERDALQQKVAELEKNDARYRFLRNRLHPDGVWLQLAGPGHEEINVRVDAAIDAALNQERSDD